MSLAQPIEVYLITPADILITFGVGLGLVVFAVLATVLVMRHPPAVDDPDATVEIPRPRRGRRKPHTGVVHASRPESNTTVDLDKIRELSGGGR